MIEASNPQERLDYTRLAFDMSKSFRFRFSEDHHKGEMGL